MLLGPIYAKLKADSSASDHPVVLIRINPHDRLCHIYLFYSKLDGPFLGVFHDNGEVLLKERPLIRGLEIDELEENGRRGTRLRPIRESGEDVFLRLCDHLVAKLSNDDDPNQISRSLLRELKLWKLFFSNAKGPLNKERLLGLSGELFTLHALLNSSGENAYEITRGWEGPNRGIHDFSYETLLFEVKSSIFLAEMRFHIFSPTQLLEIGDKNLYLIHQVFSWEASGISINNLINNVKKTIAGNQGSISVFEELISLCGYHEMHHDHYESDDLKLSHIKSDTYDVNDDFPKVLSSDTHPSVQVHGYSIEIEGCEQQLLGSFTEFLKDLEWN